MGHTISQEKESVSKLLYQENRANSSEEESWWILCNMAPQKLRNIIQNIGILSSGVIFLNIN